jgi:hypothetical protein
MIPPHSYPSNRYANSSKSDMSATERRALTPSPNEAPEPVPASIEAAPAIPSTEVSTAKTIESKNPQADGQSDADVRTGEHPNNVSPLGQTPSEPATEQRKILKVRTARTVPAASKP